MLTLAFAPGGENAHCGCLGLGGTLEVEAREAVGGLAGDGSRGFAAQPRMKVRRKRDTSSANGLNVNRRPQLTGQNSTRFYIFTAMIVSKEAGKSAFTLKCLTLRVRRLTASKY